MIKIKTSHGQAYINPDKVTYISSVHKHSDGTCWINTVVDSQGALIDFESEDQASVAIEKIRYSIRAAIVGEAYIQTTRPRT